MSLIVLFVIEFVGWVCFNRITPFSTPRVLIALSTTSGFALCIATYLAMCDLLALAQHFDLFNVMIFGLINALIALMIAFTSHTLQTRS